METFLKGLILIYLVHTLRLCSGERQMILIKFSKAVTHYNNYMQKDYTFDSDPLNNLYSSIDSKEALCNVLRNARQFTHLLKEDENESWTTDFTNIDDLDNLDFSTVELKNERCTIRVQRQKSTFRRSIQCLQCVKTEKVQWFIAFGGVDESQYLLERGQFIGNLDYRVTGILEPSAIVEHRSYLYFYLQFQNSEVETKAICSHISKDDKLRLCSSVFYALDLDTERNLPINYVKERRKCVHNFVKGRDLFELATVLPCSVCEADGTLLREFFILFDSRKNGAVFVLYDTGRKNKKKPILEKQARVINVAALLNPVGKIERMKRSSDKTAKGKQKRYLKMSSKKADKVGNKRRREGKNPMDSEDQTDSEEIMEEKFDFEIWDSPESTSDENKMETTGRKRRQRRRGKEPMFVKKAGVEEFDSEKSAEETESNKGLKLRKKKSTLEIYDSPGSTSDSEIKTWQRKQRRGKEPMFVEEAEEEEEFGSEKSPKEIERNKGVKSNRRKSASVIYDSPESTSDNEMRTRQRKRRRGKEPMFVEEAEEAFGSEKTPKEIERNKGVKSNRRKSAFVIYDSPESTRDNEMGTYWGCKQRRGKGSVSAKVRKKEFDLEVSSEEIVKSKENEKNLEDSSEEQSVSDSAR